MAMVGFGKYATPAFDFGVQKDVVIPRSIKPVAVDFKSIGKGMIQATISAPQGGDLRLIMQQYFTDGSLIRMWPTGSPKMENMGKLFCSKQSRAAKSYPFVKTTIARCGPGFHGRWARRARKI
jgi:hypothetical protein